MLPQNWGEPMGAPAISEKQIEIKLLHPTSTQKSQIQVKLVTLCGSSSATIRPAICPDAQASG
ncbi:MAG: hypothetical protein P8X74_17550 [Reinekea sp.]